uniref:Secreted protein n=1 Tax=Trichogramma kaykai TaxID=54128 RepID=A0ABD2XIS1_9HYME
MTSELKFSFALVTCEIFSLVLEMMTSGAAAATSLQRAVLEKGRGKQEANTYMNIHGAKVSRCGSGIPWKSIDETKS